MNITKVKYIIYIITVKWSKFYFLINRFIRADNKPHCYGKPNKRLIVYLILPSPFLDPG